MTKLYGFIRLTNLGIRALMAYIDVEFSFKLKPNQGVKYE